MPSLSAWYVKKGGVNYLLNNSNQRITYKTNQFQQAYLNFDITNKSDPARGAFANEDNVQLYIGDPATTGVKMMDGFITDLGDEHQKGGRVLQNLKIVDYIGYLGGKSPFEKRYWFLANAPAKTVFQDASNAISGAGVAVIDAALTKQVKMEFLGTYAKDGFSAAAQYGGADYFGDENKALRAFSFGSQALQTGGLNYKLQDTKSLASNQIKIDSNFDYKFERDSIYKFRKVIATNAISYTYPDNINSWQTEKTDIRGLYGPDFSTHYLFGSKSQYDKNLTPAPPIPYNIEELDIAGDPIPIAKLNVANSGDTVALLIGQMDLSTFTFPLLDLSIDTWQEISFFFREQLTPTPTNIEIFLIDGTAGVTYSRYIKQGATTLLLPGGMTFLRFLLPTTTANNGWTKTGAGTMTKFRQIQIIFTPNTGYTAGTSIKVGQFYFFKRVRKTSATAPGVPLTTKIIVNRTMIDETLLQNLADEEYSRVNADAYYIKATTPGNTDFKRPGYVIDVDFSNTLQSDKVGTNFRIDEINHTLEKSRHRMEILLRPSFQRY